MKLANTNMALLSIELATNFLAATLSAAFLGMAALGLKNALVVRAEQIIHQVGCAEGIVISATVSTAVVSVSTLSALVTIPTAPSIIVVAVMPVPVVAVASVPEGGEPALLFIIVLFTVAIISIAIVSISVVTMVPMVTKAALVMMAVVIAQQLAGFRNLDVDVGGGVCRSHKGSEGEGVTHRGCWY